ncbi:MAG: HAD family phosphatase [Pseudomonadota bacterium]
MTIQGLLFDCDGVLVDSEVVGLEETVRYLEDHGFRWTAEDIIIRFTGMRTDAFAQELRQGYGEVLGLPPSDEDFSKLLEGMIATRRSQRHRMTTVKGAEETLRQLSAIPSLKLAVASSSSIEVLASKIDRFGLAPYFGDHVYSADHVAHGKPAPDIFLYAAEKIGLAPENCLVIEDSAHGVTAGVQAGCHVWGFTGGGHCLAGHEDRLRDAGATQIIATHAQLYDQLKTLF